MSKINMMQIANTKCEPIYVTGERIRLKVGSVWIMFFIHEDTLSHWGTGYRLGSLNGIKVSHMAGFGHNAILSDRQAAKRLIDRLVSRHGVEGLLKAFDSVPRLNEETKKGQGIGTSPKP